jgi:predicted XRE-type DNA-binding protein
MASNKTPHAQEVENAVDCTVHIGSGNVFADTGLPNPEELQAKALISIRIEQLIKQRGLTQNGAAHLMGVTQPEVSLIVRGRLRGFTIDRLMQCVQALGQDVRIVLPTASGQDHSRGHILVEYEDAPVLTDQPLGLTAV